ncbi:unnamed protein product [Anisakis simplex]|uniref:Putative transporter (inferred by orthology to a C. elegans protein) n=1 Tax=Anisakis simplex TaxID=6269 RepID=A0A0M3JUK3_ANISI|nr:unnamed protein product [Anisakis simplex]
MSATKSVMMPDKDNIDVEQLIHSNNDFNACDNADQILGQLGARNKFILFITFILSLGWTISAMPNMCSAFIVSDKECTNSTDCKAENRTTIASEFQLSDERKYLADWTTSAFMLGNMLGATVLTQLSDKYGRRPVLIFSLIGLTLAGFISVFANNVHVVTLGRLLQGACAPGLCLVVWVLGCESIPISLRGYATLIYGTMWVIGYCAIAPLAYYITNWRLILLASTLPGVFMALLVFLFVPESLHFLVVNGRNEEAVNWVKTAQKYGQTKNTANLEKMMEVLLACKPKKDEANESSNTFVYFGLSLYVTRIAGNKYLNYVLSGLIEMPAYLFAPPALDNIGRKPVVAWSHFLAGFSLIAYVTSLCMTGKFGISCSFICIFVYGSEIFPTTIRNACLGLCLVVARFGGIVAPYVKHLEAISPSLPMVFFGSIGVAAGVLTLFLPETKNRALPSSLNDVAAERK